jgi:hypothetical protein
MQQVHDRSTNLTCVTFILYLKRYLNFNNEHAHAVYMCNYTL